MSRDRRVTVKVSDDTHRSIKLIANALGIRHGEVLDRAVAPYRLRHTKAIAELLSRGGLENLSDLPYRERIDLLRDVIKEKAGGGTVWVVQDQGMIGLVIDPAPEDMVDLLFDLEELLGAQVSVMSLQQATDRGYNLAASPYRCL